MPQLSVATTAALPHSHRLSPRSPEANKALSRLSRPSLISLALKWLDEENRAFCMPYLARTDEEEDEDAPYDAVGSVDELREVYEELQQRKGAKREIVDRIIEGDWRQGISLYQLATADARYLIDHPSSLRWNAQRLVRYKSVSKDGQEEALEVSEELDALPQLHWPTFLLNLQRELAPIAKAHYYLAPMRVLPITLLRVYIHDSPYNTQSSVQDASKGKQPHPDGSKPVFVLFTDGSPYVYISAAATPRQAVGSDVRSLRSVIIDAVPKAISRPFHRYTLKSTALSARSLSALTAFRGAGRPNVVSGGWSVFATGTAGASALDANSDRGRSSEAGSRGADSERENAAQDPKRDRAGEPQSGREESPAAKRRKQIAAGRFGDSGLPDDGKGIEQFDVRIADPFPAVSKSAEAASEDTSGARRRPEETARGRGRKRASILDPTQSDEEESGSEWKPDVRLSFRGSHVFAGIRKLVEDGIIDGERMPGWLTGEAGVSVGVVRDGKLLVKKNM